jgi:uncharacterized membrane protein YkvA (DUF1232 family)
MAQAESTKTKSLLELLQKLILHLPQELKILIETLGDSELGVPARSVALGAISYVIYFGDLITDKIPVVGWIDDVLVIWIALGIIEELEPEHTQTYREKYPETFDQLGEVVQIIQSSLGFLYDALKSLVELFKSFRFRKHTAEEVFQSKEAQEAIFDATMERVAGMNLNPEFVHQHLSKVNPAQVMKLLSSGMEAPQLHGFGRAQRAPELPSPVAQKLLSSGRAKH